MPPQNTIENLELKLLSAKEKNYELFKEAQSQYNENYKDFVEKTFTSDSLGLTRDISSQFQLEYFNTLERGGVDATILEKSFHIALEYGVSKLPLTLSQKSLLLKKVSLFDSLGTQKIETTLSNQDFIKNYNYPILTDLQVQGILESTDIITIGNDFKKTANIKLSLSNISKEKRDTLLHYFFQLNSTNHITKENDFKSEYSSQIKNLESQFSGPIIDGVVSFVGRNYFKLKPYKKNIESKNKRLKRTFKIALLRLLRVKYSQFNIDTLLKQIDSLDDFESMFKLMQKLIDIIPENKELLEQYTKQEHLDEVVEIISEAESNKEKILKGEEATLKICTILSENEQILDTKLLDIILDDTTSIIGNEVLVRKKEDVISQNTGDQQNGGNLFDGKKIVMNAGVLHSTGEANVGEDEDETEDKKALSDDELIQKYQEIKLEYTIAEKKKQHMFASGLFDSLDEINDKILEIMIRLEKISLFLQKEEEK